MAILVLIIFMVLAFFMGSIPFGLIITKKVANTDVRKYGSGSIGATNVTRVIGKKYAALTVLLDGLKGVIPIVLARFYFNDPSQISYLALIGLTAVLGHIFSIYLNFKGGKGFATTIFVTLTLSWELGIGMILLWLICYKLTKISSLSTLVSLSTTTLFSYIIEPTIFPIYVILTVIIFYAHRENIKRLINKEELGFKENGKTKNN